MAHQRPRRIDRHQSGNVTLIFAITGVAVVGMIGGGVEIGRALEGKAKLQSALDAGALAAAGMADGTTSAVREAMAQKVVAANLPITGGVMPSTLTVSPDFSQADRVTLTGQVKVETILGRSIFGGFHTINAVSTAQKATAGTPAIAPPSTTCPAQPNPTDAPAQVLPPPPPAPPPPAPPPPSPPPPAASPAGNGCIWALSTANKDGTLRFNSGNNLQMPSCRIHVHGPHNQSIQWNSGNTLNVDKMFTKGGINCNATCLSSFQSYAGSNVVNDPYAGLLPQLTPGSCMPSAGPYNGSVTLNPGTYCSDITVQGSNPVLTLNPGIYIISGGNWNMNGVQINGNGVTIYFHNNVQFNLNGNTRFNLTAPSSGQTAGLAMYERTGLGQATLPIDSGGGMNINGVVYLPSKELIFNSGNQVSSSNLQIIAREIQLNNTRYTISPYTGPLPPGVGSSPPPPPAPPPPSPPPASPPPLPVSTGSGLLTNGSFEQPVIPTGTFQLRTIAQGVTGWTTTKMFELHNSAFWANAGGYGTDGIQYLELIENISQSVTLPANKTYRFEFDYRYGNDGSASENRFQVEWGTTGVVANVQPVQGQPWKRMSIPIRGTGAPVTFTFRQVAPLPNGQGPFLDRVRITEDNTLTAPPTNCPGGLPGPPPPPPTPAVPPSALRIIR